METTVSWVATVATIAAACLTAYNLGARITGFVFIVFTAGSIAWLTLGALTGQPALLWTNIVLTGLNLFGVWRWLGRQARVEQGAERAAAESEILPSETLIAATLLARAPVVGRDGSALGTMVDAMVGCRTGRLAYLVVAEGGVAGVGEVLRRVDWSAAEIASDAVTTRLDGAEFSRLPALARDNWPGR